MGPPNAHLLGEAGVLALLRDIVAGALREVGGEVLLGRLVRGHHRRAEQGH